MARSEEFPLLKPHGLKAVEIVGDGNCLFNALSDQIYGDQRKNEEIRATVIQHMRETPDEYKPFVNVEVGGGQRRNPKRKNVGAYSTPFDSSPPTQKQIDDNWEAYLERMARGGTYGDNVEIRAFAKAYNTDVRIHLHDYDYYVRAAHDGVVRPVAHIAYHTWEHYSSVRNINGPFTGLPNVQMKEDITPAEQVKVDAQIAKGPFIADWMVKAVTTSLPHLTSEDTIRQALKESGGSVDGAVSALMEDPPSAPGTPGSFSQSGSSSIERDPDSDDEEIYGPNKRQNRRIRATKTSKKVKEAREKREAELQAIPTIELTKPESDAASDIVEIAGHNPSKFKAEDDEYIAPSGDDASEYSASSHSQSVAASTPPPTRTQQPKIILRTKTSQRQHGPTAKKPRARDIKEMKKAAQKQARKERARKDSQPTPQLAKSTINVNTKRSSPPMEQVIGMKTLYI